MKFLTMILLAIFCLTFINSVYALFYDFENANQEKDWTLFAGKGRIEGGRYIIEKTNANDAISVIGTPDWTDCTVVCKAKLLEGSADNMGLVWRLLDGKTFYVISIRMDQRVGYCGCLNGTWMNGGSPINPQPFETKVGKDYEMKLIVKGKKFQFYVDGKDMGEWEHEELKKGMVGVRVWNAIMAVDYFDINGPGIPATAVEYKEKIAAKWGQIKSSL